MRIIQSECGRNKSPNLSRLSASPTPGNAMRHSNGARGVRETYIKAAFKPCTQLCFSHPGLSVTVCRVCHQVREHPNPPVERPCTAHGSYHPRDTKTLQSRRRICPCLKAKSRSHDALFRTLHGGDANTAQVQADWRQIKNLGGSSTKLNPSRPKRQPFLRIFKGSQYKYKITLTPTFYRLVRPQSGVMSIRIALFR